MEEVFTVKGISGISTMNRAAYEKYLKALDNRRIKGRYTLEEAATFIYEATGSRADEMRIKLMTAASTGSLPVYEPSKKSRYQYGGDFATSVRDFYEEAFYNDLNEWLKNNEPLLVCKFPDPNGEAYAGVKNISNDSAICSFSEFINNGETIEWAEYWAVIKKISPQQAGKLIFCIDPIIWPNNKIACGNIGNDLRIKIERCTQYLNDISQEWTLASIVQAIGDDGVPFAMKQALDESRQVAAPAKTEAIRGITKSAVINAFEGLHFDRDQWSNALGKNIPDWLKECRVTKGIQGSKVSATWNPALIAASLIDKGITAKRLDAVFVSLEDWAEEWRDASALFRD